MRVAVMTVGMFVRMIMPIAGFDGVRWSLRVDRHGQGQLYEFAGLSAACNEGWLLESMATGTREFVDGSSSGCHHQKWLKKPGECIKGIGRVCKTDGDEQPNRQIEFLGCAWIDANG